MFVYVLQADWELVAAFGIVFHISGLSEPAVRRVRPLPSHPAPHCGRKVREGCKVFWLQSVLVFVFAFRLHHPSPASARRRDVDLRKADMPRSVLHVDVRSESSDAIEHVVDGTMAAATDPVGNNKHNRRGRFHG